MCSSIRSAVSRFPRKPKSVISNSSRPSSRRAMRKSSATRSRKPIWSPIRVTVKTCSIATWIMPMPGSKIRTSRTPIPAMLNRNLLNQELTKIEKPAGITNPKDFRNEVVKFSLRSRAQNSGKNPSWTSYEKIREVIEKRIFSQVEDLLPVISFGSKKDGETEKKHGEFVERMVGRGYTERQVRRLVEWYMRVKQAG